MIIDKFSTLLILTILVLSGFKADAGQEYREYVQEIESSFARQMFDEFGLVLSGSLNSMHENVKVLGLDFITHRRATLEEARALEVLVIDRFVQAINAHEKIQFYLDVRPFSFKRATISISFQGMLGRYSDGSITYMFNVTDLACTPYKNHIIYRSHNPFKDDLIPELNEPYEEAVRLNTASPVDPHAHQGNAYEEEMDNLLAAFKEEVYNRYGIHVWHIGGNWKGGIQDIGATIKLSHFSSQQEARQLLVEVAQKLLLVINENEKIRPYLKTYPFPPSLLKLSFHFESTHENPLPDIRMYRMNLENNEIFYVQEMVPPPKEGEFFRLPERTTLPSESYEEALQIVENHPQKLKISSTPIFSALKTWLTNFMYILLAF